MGIRTASSSFFRIIYVHAGGLLACAALQGVLMFFAKLFPLCPASTQSAQADFVSPAPDFNLENQTYRSSVDPSGNNKSKSISARMTKKRACSAEMQRV
jgi:hypothetical protein